MLHVLLHDLQDNAALIAEYERQHQRIWPEVAAHIRSHGVLDMRIYRLGTRLVMLMTTNDATYNAQAMQQAASTNPRIRAWEALMDTMQAPTPWTPAGRKWVAAECIFALAQQP